VKGQGNEERPILLLLPVLFFVFFAVAFFLLDGPT